MNFDVWHYFTSSFSSSHRNGARIKANAPLCNTVNHEAHGLIQIDGWTGAIDLRIVAGEGIPRRRRD